MIDSPGALRSTAGLALENDDESRLALTAAIVSTWGSEAGNSSGLPWSNSVPAAATAGCGKAPTLTSGQRTIQSSGQNRGFILRIPDNYDRNHAYRLIFGFHWNGGTAGDVDGGGSDGAAWSYYGLRQQANNSTIFVAPQGNGNGWANPGGQDVTFVEGPILKHFNLSTLKFETAGHSVGQASDMHLTGIIDAQAFRAQIMQAREALRHPPRDKENDEQLIVLRAIEAKLGEIAELLRARQ